MNLINKKQEVIDFLYNKCLHQLKEKYGVNVFDDEIIIEEQIKYVRDFYISELKTYLHSNLEFIFFHEMILWYKDFNDSKKYNNGILSSDDKTLLKRILLLSIGEATNLNLNHRTQQISDDELIYMIFFLLEIADKLHYFSNKLYSFYLIGKDKHYFEITDTKFAITVADREYGNKYNKFVSEYNDEKNTHKMNHREEDFHDIRMAIINCFGEDSYYDLFEDARNSNNTMNVVDDVTDIVNKLLKNNPNFVNAFILHQFSIEDSLKKPHNEDRLRYRPILKLNIENKIRYFTSSQLIYGALCELATNKIPFGSGDNCLPREWREISKMKAFAEKISNEKGASFERLIDNYVSDKYILMTDLKDINKIKIHNALKGSPEEKVGQIDVLIFDVGNKKLFVADCKNRKSRFESASWAAEKDVYDNDAVKLNRKKDWVNQHLNDVALELKRIKGIDIIKEVLDFEVIAIFIVDTFTELAFNFSPKIIMMRKINEELIKF